MTRIALDEILTKRPISEGAEKWLGNPIKCLNHGFIYLLDYMGNDEAVVQAARVSYGKGTRKISEDRGLIRYLRRHKHTTPFEMCEIKFHAKMPIFVARQWVRHRTANINEYSARYSILDKEFYVPEPEILAAQSKSNRQGRDKAIPADEAESIRQLIIEDASRCYASYEYMLNDDGSGNQVDTNRSMLARELARMDLNLNYYTQWYWKIDLHNLFHFLRLRMDPHAQWEIKVYADAMAQIAKNWVPICWEAFEDYELYAMSLSRPEIKVLKRMLKGLVVPEENLKKAMDDAGLTNKRERSEFEGKLKKIVEFPEKEE